MAPEPSLSTLTTPEEVLEQHGLAALTGLKSDHERSNTWPQKVQPDDPLYNKGHIRLLYIESIDASNIECSLWEYPAPSSMYTPYAALSYCCGNDTGDQTIYLNEMPFFVTFNLLGALKSVSIHSFKDLTLVHATSLDFTYVCYGSMPFALTKETTRRSPFKYNTWTRYLTVQKGF